MSESAAHRTRLRTLLTDSSVRAEGFEELLPSLVHLLSESRISQDDEELLARAALAVVPFISSRVATVNKTGLVCVQRIVGTLGIAKHGKHRTFAPSTHGYLWKTLANASAHGQLARAMAEEIDWNLVSSLLLRAKWKRAVLIGRRMVPCCSRL